MFKPARSPFVRGASAARVPTTTSGLRRTVNLPSRTTFTFVGWFRREAVGSGTQDIVGCANTTSSPSYAYQLSWNDSTLRVDWYGGGFNNAAFARTPAVGEPFFAALTAAPSGSNVVLRGYCISPDGTAYETVTTTTSTDAWIAAAFNIGHQGWSEAGNFSAWGVRLWDATLTVGEIWAEWANGGIPARRRNLNAWWPLEGNPNQLILDRGGNNRPLTIGGSTRDTRFFLPRHFVDLDDVRGKAPAAGTTISVPTATHSYVAQVAKLMTVVAVGVVAHTYTAQAPKTNTAVRVPVATHAYVAQAPQVRARVQPAQVTHTYVSQTPKVNVRVSPAQVTHTYTAQTPQVRTNVQPGAVTHTYVAQVPTITVSGGATTVSAPVATHTYVAQTPQVKARVQPGAVSHAYVAQTPQARANVQPGTVTHAYVAQAPQVQARVQPPTVTHTYLGQVPTISVVGATVVQVPVASHTYTAQIPELSGVAERVQAAGKSKRKQLHIKKRIVVTIDDETFYVSSEDEARNLLEVAADQAEKLAQAQANLVVEKRKARQKRDGYINRTPIKIDTPVIKASAEDEAISRLIHEYQARLDAIYAAAKQQAEIFLLEQVLRDIDDDDAIALLLSE